jgi:hypothetical protein
LEKSICENQRHLQEKKKESPADCADSRREKQNINNKISEKNICENQRVLRETKKTPADYADKRGKTIIK